MALYMAMSACTSRLVTYSAGLEVLTLSEISANSFPPIRATVSVWQTVARRRWPIC